MGKYLAEFIKDSFRFDHEKILDEILEFTRRVVKDADASGVVLGLSGGVDSALAAALCARALGKDKVQGVLMPASFTPKRDIADAVALAKMLGIRTESVDIDGICNAFIKALNISGEGVKMRIPLANVRARIRMMILYFYANANNCLVVGTSDRSETLIGFFTKYGDGAADFFPIRHLYKTQVKDLAKHLGIPKRIVTKPSSPQLYPGHKLSDEVLLDYDRLDPVLVGLFDHGLSPERVSEMTRVPLSTILEFIARHKRTAHKRKLSPMIESSKVEDEAFPKG